MILLCHNTLAKSYDSKVGLIIQKRCILVTVFAALLLPILLYACYIFCCSPVTNIAVFLVTGYSKYDAIQGKASKAKKEDAPERLALSNGAEKTLGAFNTIVLVIGLIIAVLCILVGILADFDQKWILVLSGAVVIIPFILSWAVLKVYLNISNNLHEINAKLKK